VVLLPAALTAVRASGEYEPPAVVNVAAFDTVNAVTVPDEPDELDELDESDEPDDDSDTLMTQVLSGIPTPVTNIPALT
jgi:hypothetical protein